MDTPLPYLQRIKEYYLALGYDTPYRWAQFDHVPFQPLQKPLEDARLAIVTTAAPFQSDKGDQGPGAPYNGSAKFFEVYDLPTTPEPDLRISHIAIDRAHTTAEDQGSYFPLRAFKALADNGNIGAVSLRIYGLPTNRSHKTTIEVDCEELKQRAQRDEVDIAVLLPNCPVCHQSVSLAARTLENAGIPTVVMGCAKDIVEYVGVPRFLFSDFPLGNAAGPPNDKAAQLETARLALELFKSATVGRTTLTSPLRWPGAPNWKKNYSNASLLSKTELKARRKAFDQGKAAAKEATFRKT